MDYIIPSWRDLDVLIETDGFPYVDYKIVTSNGYRYEGRAYPKQEGEDAIVRVSSIIRNAVNPYYGLPLYSGTRVEIMQNSIVDAQVIIKEEVVHNVRMVLDNTYSTQPNYNEPSQILTRPITNVIDPRQHLVFNVMNYMTSSDVEVNGETISYYHDTFQNALFSVPVTNTKEMTVKVGNKEYKYTVKPSESDYCLYYVNKLGGYDSILLNRKTIEKNSLTPTTFRRYGNNTNPTHQKVKQQILNVKSVEFTTQWLKDNQIQYIDDLFESSCCYLQNLKSGKVIPVNIANNAYDKKTMRANGRKYNNFVITLEYSINQVTI